MLLKNIIWCRFSNPAALQSMPGQLTV